MRRKSLIWLVKYYPIFGSLGILAAMLFGYLGMNAGQMISPIIGCVVWPSIIIFILSEELHFCKWHRALLINVMLYAILHVIEKLGVKYNYYIYTALFINIVCIAFALINYSIHGCYTKKTCKRSKRTDKKD